MMIWREIPSLGGRYEASENGDIRHVVNHKIRRARKGKHGYMQMNFPLNDGTGKSKTMLIHRLIAETFIPNPNNYSEINHIDGDKTNNCIKNLEWCSRSYNQIHAIKNGLRTTLKGENAPGAKFTHEQVKEIRKIYCKGVSETSLAILLNVSQSTIGRIVRGEGYKYN